MDIFAQALALELEGEELYRSLAQDATDTGAGYIFSRLADQEKRHYGILKAMKQDVPQLDEKDIVLKNVRDIFEDWKKAGIHPDIQSSQLELYQKALKAEENTIRIYKDGAAATNDEEVRYVLLRIASEEELHRQVMENIIEFVSKPDIWVENAEFGYRGKDYYL